jgi:Ulp1 family protease
MPLRFIFEDIDIYDEDISLLQRGGWLNDSCISFCLQMLKQKSGHDKVQMINASVMSFMMLQITEQEEFDELRVSLELDKFNWLIVPVNDNQSFSERSTHWSVLICNIKSGRMLHFDSSGNSNLMPSRRTGQRVAELLQLSRFALFPV